MRNFLLVFFALLLQGCSDKSGNPLPDRQELQPAHSDKPMKVVEAGSYKGFFGKDSANTIQVKGFQMDESPVTNAEFLEFVKKNPQWARSNVLRIYADSTYLKSWQGDFELPKDKDKNAPVTNVSWYAANAYAKSVGKRLPTIDEWEFAAIADANRKDASKDPEFTRYILSTYAQKMEPGKPVKSGRPNFYGLYDMYGLVWEWTEDFNSVMVSGESRDDKVPNESLFCAGAAVTSSDLENYAAFMRFALRGSLRADYCLNNLGFRCAKDLNEN